MDFQDVINSRFLRTGLSVELRQSLERLAELRPETLEPLIQGLENQKPWPNISAINREANINLSLNLEALYEIRRILPQLVAAGIRLEQTRQGLEKLYDKT